MTTYTVCFFDSAGFVEVEVEIDFDTDQDAIAAAFGAERPFGCELWSDERFLGLFPAPAALARVSS